MSIVAIRYYNVWFYLHLQSELDGRFFLWGKLLINDQ